jgi:protein SCO1
MGWRGISATVAALVVSVALLIAATDGFHAVTSEGARRWSIAQSPRPLPAVTLEDQDGRFFHLNDLAGRLVLVEFIYTRCPTICLAAGDTFAGLTRQLAKPLAGGEVTLLSISFDPEDDRQGLANYAAAHGADGRRWRVVRPINQVELERLLATCDVVVIPDGEGGFIHNAGVYVVDRRGRLSSVLDLGPPKELGLLLEPRL